MAPAFRIGFVSATTNAWSIEPRRRSSPVMRPPAHEKFDARAPSLLGLPAPGPLVMSPTAHVAPAERVVTRLVAWFTLAFHTS